MGLTGKHCWTGVNFPATSCSLCAA